MSIEPKETEKPNKDNKDKKPRKKRTAASYAIEFFIKIGITVFVVTFLLLFVPSVLT